MVHIQQENKHFDIVVMYMIRIPMTTTPKQKPTYKLGLVTTFTDYTEDDSGNDFIYKLVATLLIATWF